MAKKKNNKNKGGGTKTVSQSAKSASITDSINTEVIAEAIEALSSKNHSVLLKLCRLCETKDGPFLNIFEADKVIAKKIADLMPFGIEENDDLPHKICFRCSAKVEELHEFVQKCVKTQESLRNALGLVGPLATKAINRTLWEEKLNKSNMSNDDICNALIKKAMEGIKDIPLNLIPIENNDKPISTKEIKADTQLKEKEIGTKKEVESKKKEPELPIKQGKTQLEKIDSKAPTTKVNQSSNDESLFDSLPLRSKKTRQSSSINQKDDTTVSEKLENGTKRKATSSKLEESSEPPVKKVEEKPVENNDNKKPFNIMDHISMIKVNGVGVLFQCKLCNRNFLKKDIVMSHSCAKNGGPKQEAIPDYVPPPPKVPTVKYINTKTDSLHPKPVIVNDKPIVLDDELSPPVRTKPKPKAGPASKVRRNSPVLEMEDNALSTAIKIIPSLKSDAPTVQFPNIPSLNSRYKLVPGPNNTFTLVEEKVSESTLYVSSDDSNSDSLKTDTENKKVESKAKQNETSTSSKKHKIPKSSIQETSVEERDMPSDKPYPVGLIKKVGHHSNDYTQPISDSIAFTTPAMKKQSYTIVQTGNPSKLLISTKPQQVPDEIPKKRTKKGHQETKDAVEQPFSVTLEDATPPKDPGFFTFINVDPLLQPSYVLPTNNIIQESQISTSTPINTSLVVENKDNKYTCNMCGDSFSREKKLLAHIHSHYNKMDEEDQIRQKTKKRGRK